VIVFAYDHCSKKICLAKTNGGAVKTGENKDVFDVSLDDGRIIRATRDHPFMMRDGSYKRVDELKPYDSLMPFYMRIGRSGYKQVFQPRVEMFSTQRMALNHCVLKIEYVGKEDVYDLSVPGYHNFACEGVFVHNCLDLYADNATKEKGDAGDAIEVKSDNPKVRNILEGVTDRTGIQETLWDTARGMSKYGDEFDEVVVDSNNLITKLKNLQAKQMFKNIDEFGRLKDKPYIQKDETGGGGNIAEFEPWQIVHWKNGGMKKMYGESVMKSIRRVYKQLQLMEDGLVIGRLTRSHLRYKILVDVEGMDKEEREAYVKAVKKEFKKKALINPLTGQLETTQNPLSAEEDFFLGVTKDSKADVSVLQGATNLGNIRDVEYFQTKLFAGLKVPKAFVGLEKDVKAKATIVEEDIQFARTVGRIRKGLRRGLTQIYDHQLMLQGVLPSKGLYVIRFAPISMVDEMRKWTMEKLKAEVAKIYKIDMGILTNEYILKNYIGLSDEEIAGLEKEKKASFIAPSPKKVSVPSLRAAGLSGVVGPAVGGLSPSAMVAQKDDDRSDGFHIATLQMMNLVETLRDLVDLELNR
jgi:hypothetical protein